MNIYYVLGTVKCFTWNLTLQQLKKANTKIRIPHIRDKETKVRRDDITCARLQLVNESEFKPRQSGSKTQGFHPYALLPHRTHRPQKLVFQRLKL